MFMTQLGRYKHFKGGEYEVIANVLLETEANGMVAGVLYKHADDTPQLFVRSEQNFFEEVDIDDLTKGPRFVFIEESTSKPLNAADLMVIHDTLYGSLSIVGSAAPWTFTKETRTATMETVLQKLKDMPV